MFYLVGFRSWIVGAEADIVRRAHLLGQNDKIKLTRTEMRVDELNHSFGMWHGCRTTLEEVVLAVDDDESSNSRTTSNVAIRTLLLRGTFERCRIEISCEWWPRGQHGSSCCCFLFFYHPRPAMVWCQRGWDSVVCFEFVPDTLLPDLD